MHLQSSVLGGKALQFYIPGEVWGIAGGPWTDLNPDPRANDPHIGPRFRAVSIFQAPTARPTASEPTSDHD